MRSTNRKTSAVAILVIVLLAFAVLLARTCRAPRLRAALFAGLSWDATPSTSAFSSCSLHPSELSAAITPRKQV
jgi:hypothetical protein